MKLSLRTIAATLAAALIILPAAANAVVLVSFQPILSSVTPGSTVNYNAIFTNIGLGKQPTYTVTDADYVALIGKQADFMGQFNGAPTFKIGDGVTTIDDFFSLTVSNSVKAGIYGGFINVDGFANNEKSSYSNFSVQDLPITVGAVALGITPTPEPSQTIVLGIGALVIGVLVFAKRRKTANSISN